MLCWAMIFYDVEMRGITFIYYIIKPQLWLGLENMALNVLLSIIYYSLLIFVFNGAVKLFFKLNNLNALSSQ